MKVLDWIFEAGELEFMPRVYVDEFLKSRFNNSLNLIGYSDEFETSPELLEKSSYLTNMLTATTDFDFFDQRSTSYSKGSSYDPDNLF
jgi:ribonucleoside-diphosphate reductase beta chain